MALFTEESLQYLEKTTPTLLGSAPWNSLFGPGEKVLVSGIYRCEGCGDEITSNKGDPFPPQNTHQHPGVFDGKVQWRLIVETQTKG